MSLPLLPMLAIITGGMEIPTFVEEAKNAGLQVVHLTEFQQLTEAHMMTPGAGVGDFDRDGDLDLFVQGGVGQNAQLFINDGTGHFDDRASEWGVDLIAEEGASVTVGDVNADGFLDIYAGTIIGRNQLLLNVNGVAFVDIAAGAGVAVVETVPFKTFGASMGDLDGDGDLDLVTAEWGDGTPAAGDQLFLNQGNLQFSRATEAAGLYTTPFTSYTFTPAVVDLNGDRHADVAIAADFLTSSYYANNGDGTVTRLVGNGTGSDENGMGSVFGDYDNDGDLDWFVTSIFDDDGNNEGNWGITGNRLYRNDGDHQFTDRSQVAGVRHGHWGWGGFFGDLNHDGWLDLGQANGFVNPAGFNPDRTFEDDPARLWLNTGADGNEAAFVEVAQAAGFTHTADGKGLIAFDADNDGDLDLFMTTNQGAHTFYRNQFNPAPDRWIELELIAPPGNPPDGIGATVEVTTMDGTTYHRAVFATSSFMSQGSLRAHFGFPSSALLDAIEITWPDGSVTLLTNVASGRIVVVPSPDLSGDGVVDVIDLLAMLGGWGPCAGCDGDLNVDGSIDVLDLLALLGRWG